MPVAPTFPGVYVEEVPSGVHPIAGVPTAIAAFVGWFPRGPMNTAEEVLSFADVERRFGGLHRESDTSFALQQYFLNGGARAWVVRVAGAAGLARAHADVPLAGGGTAFVVRARDEGAWGNALRVQVLGGAAADRYDLVVSLVGTDGGRPAVLRQEEFRGLTSTAAGDPNFLPTAVNDTSELIVVEPPASGSYGTPALSGLVSTESFAAPPDREAKRRIKIGLSATSDTYPVTSAELELPGKLGSLEQIAETLQSGVRTAHAGDPRWAQAVVRLVPDPADVTKGRLQLLPGVADPLIFKATDAEPSGGGGGGGGGTEPTVKELRLDTLTPAAGSVGLTGGGDGARPGAADLVGSATGTGSGMFALENTDFTLLCLPSLGNQRAGDPDRFADSATVDAQYANVIGNAVAYCRHKRALLLVDPPDTQDSPAELRTWLQGRSFVRDEFSALYFPRLTIADPTSNYRPRSVGPGGTIAGLMARTDAARGVWKAPAGTEAKLLGVQRIDHDLTDPENGVLNPIAVNCLRTFPAYGQVSWGARTLAGSDASPSDYKYVPVRRLANFLESSLLIGLKWAVFEPNDEPLWSQIRLNIGSFMHGLFRQGAFAGLTPKEAYLVRCDATTTTPTDQGLGVVNVLVGFAPLRPAEFVILRVQQLAGQTQS
ncbi:phage tail sheath family protein [Kitasatospora sp. NPDC004240]